MPVALRGRFEGEPRYLDLRWARDEDELDLRHSRFREAIADLAAPIHGMAKDELESEDVRRHRHGMRLARAAVLALVVFAITAAVATLFAVGSAARANEQADRARLAATQAREAEETARRREAEAVEARNAEKAAAQRARSSAADAERAADEALAAEAAAADERDRAQEAETNARSAEAARALEAARAEASARTAEREAERARTSARAAEAANLLAQRRRNEALRALDDAERSAAGAQAHALVNSAFNMFDEGRFDLGMLLAAESRNAARDSGGVVSDDLGRNALLTGLLSEPTLRTTLHGSGAGTLEMAFDPTGERIAFVDLGGWVHVWDVHRARVGGSEGRRCRERAGRERGRSAHLRRRVRSGPHLGRRRRRDQHCRPTLGLRRRPHAQSRWVPAGHDGVLDERSVARHKCAAVGCEARSAGWAVARASR